MSHFTTKADEMQDFLRACQRYAVLNMNMDVLTMTPDHIVHLVETVANRNPRFDVQSFYDEVLDKLMGEK